MKLTPPGYSSWDYARKRRWWARVDEYRRAGREGRSYHPKPGKHPEEMLEWVRFWLSDPQLEATYEAAPFLEWVDSLGSVGTGDESDLVISHSDYRLLDRVKETGIISGWNIDRFTTAFHWPMLCNHFLDTLPVVNGVKRVTYLSRERNKKGRAGTHKTSRKAA